jgi:acyl-coenzyme A thioesterase PaaI-like protein
MKNTVNEPVTIEELNRCSKGHLPGLIGMEVVALDADGITLRLPVRPELLAPNGYLHAATVVALADTTCGYGTMVMLPHGATAQGGAGARAAGATLERDAGASGRGRRHPLRWPIPFGAPRPTLRGATGFTTIELKTNFVGTARDGVILCRGSAVHLGRSTQVWDATVTAEDSGRAIAVFRCTQMILHG